MSTEIENLKSFDPFADVDGDNGGQTQVQEKIHIRIQQRNGRKTLTTVQGLPSVLDFKKILKVVKKEFACNGTIIDDEAGQVIQLQGDQRKQLKGFLVNELEINGDDIKVHGF